MSKGKILLGTLITGQIITVVSALAMTMITIQEKKELENYIEDIEDQAQEFYNNSNKKIKDLKEELSNTKIRLDNANNALNDRIRAYNELSSKKVGKKDEEINNLKVEVKDYEDKVEELTKEIKRMQSINDVLVTRLKQYEPNVVRDKLYEMFAGRS